MVLDQVAGAPGAEGFLVGDDAEGQAAVQRVAQKYIAPDRFAVMVVGDRNAIEPGIRALNLVTVKELTVDEVFGS